MAAQWFYQAKGRQLGPVDSRELRRLAEAGVVRPDTLVRQGTNSRWVHAEHVRGLFKTRSTPPASPSVVASPLVPPPVPPPIREFWEKRVPRPTLGTMNVQGFGRRLRYLWASVVPPAALRTRGVHGYLHALLIALAVLAVLVVVSLPLGFLFLLAEIGSYLAEKESVDAPQETDWDAVLTEALGPAPSRPPDYVPPQSAPSASVKPGLTDERVRRILDRAWAHLIAGEYDRAIADFTEAIRLDPKCGSAYRGRGNAYKEKGDSDKARADFDQAKRLGYNP